MKRQGFTLVESLLAAVFLLLWLLPLSAACRALLRAQGAVFRSVSDLDELQSALDTGRPLGKVERDGGTVRLGDRVLGLERELREEEGR